MWNPHTLEHRAQYRAECMADAERWRLVKRKDTLPVSVTLLARAGRSLIQIGQRLAALDTPVSPQLEPTRRQSQLS